MPIYSIDPGDGIPDELDLIENLLAEAEAMAPAYAWDAEAGELAWADPDEDVLALDGPDQDGWEDPAAAAAVLETAVIADARLHDDEETDDEVASVAALVPLQARRSTEGVAA